MEYGFQTIDKINDLIKSGVDKISVILRHSARNYDHKRPHMEAFMGLTEDGKKFAKDYAGRLNFDGSVSFFSSMICRCVETSFMMEKGISGCRINSNRLEECLFPFYVKNPKKVYEVVVNHGEDQFFRMWFKDELSEKVISNSKESALKIFRFMRNNLTSNKINFMVSHDWNLYIVQEYFLKLSYNDVNRVEFLDGFILYEADGKLFIMNKKGFVRALNETA